MKIPLQPAEDDPIIAEIRKFREDYAASCGYDIAVMRKNRGTFPDWPGGHANITGPSEWALAQRKKESSR